LEFVSGDGAASAIELKQFRRLAFSSRQ
jgi:hypothetical protein